MSLIISLVFTSFRYSKRFQTIFRQKKMNSKVSLSSSVCHCFQMSWFSNIYLVGSRLLFLGIFKYLKNLPDVKNHWKRNRNIYMENIFAAEDSFMSQVVFGSKEALNLRPRVTRQKRNLGVPFQWPQNSWAEESHQICKLERMIVDFS